MVWSLESSETIFVSSNREPPSETMHIYIIYVKCHLSIIRLNDSLEELYVCVRIGNERKQQIKVTRTSWSCYWCFVVSYENQNETRNRIYICILSDKFLCSWPILQAFFLFWLHFMCKFIRAHIYKSFSVHPCYVCDQTKN